MALPNDSHASTPGAGTTWATHLVGGKEYPVGMEADSEGHLKGSLPAFGLVIPAQAAAAGKIYFDLHTTTSVVRLRKLFAVAALDVAVAPVVGIRLDVMRTSAAGTGGTAAATAASASKTAGAIWPFTPGVAVPAGITARVVPTAGATDEQWLFPAFVSLEEAMGGATTPPGEYMMQGLNLLPELAHDQPIELTAGKGLKVVQGTVAGAGNLGFLVVFSVES